MPFKNRPFQIVAAVIVVAFAGFYARDYFFIVRGVSIEAVPATCFPGDTCVVTVRFLNSAGKRVPFAHPHVDFEITEGGEYGALEDARAPDKIYLHTILPGIVVLHIRVQGFAFPFEKTVRITAPIG